VSRPFGALQSTDLATSGGRSWWAHFKFIPINIALIILKNQIEDLMNVKGIGEKNFIKLKARLTVSAPKA
jgi:hypothetical protein